MLSIETEGQALSRRRRQEILSDLASCFADQAFVEAVKGTFVIQAIGYGVYEHIQKELLNKSRTIKDHTVRFVMTPLVNRGIYHGRMGERCCNPNQPIDRLIGAFRWTCQTPTVYL